MGQIERQSGEFVRKAETMVRNLGLDPKGDGTNAISTAFPNTSRIVGLPGNTSCIRGFAVSLLIVDEAAYVDDSMYHALRPMLAATDGDLWMMSTPNGKRGFFYQTWTYGQDWERFLAPATDCKRISPRFLAEERDALGPIRFPQEYLCKFTEADGAMYGQQLIEKAIVSSVKSLDRELRPESSDWASTLPPR